MDLFSATGPTTTTTAVNNEVGIALLDNPAFDFGNVKRLVDDLDLNEFMR